MRYLRNERFTCFSFHYITQISESNASAQGFAIRHIVPNFYKSFLKLNDWLDFNKLSLLPLLVQWIFSMFSTLLKWNDSATNWGRARSFSWKTISFLFCFQQTRAWDSWRDAIDKKTESCLNLKLKTKTVPSSMGFLLMSRLYLAMNNQTRVNNHDTLLSSIKPCFSNVKQQILLIFHKNFK